MHSTGITFRKLILAFQFKFLRLFTSVAQYLLLYVKANPNHARGGAHVVWKNFKNPARKAFDDDKRNPAAGRAFQKSKMMRRISKAMTAPPERKPRNPFFYRRTWHPISWNLSPIYINFFVCVLQYILVVCDVCTCDILSTHFFRLYWGYFAESTKQISPKLIPGKANNPQ